MDTRFWGPPGWRLLHLITFATAEGTGGPVESVKEMFELMEYVLPCKFCRRSYSDYIANDPVPSNASEFPKWLWRIHNKVNEKLKNQGLSTAEDPPFPSVKRVYLDRLQTGCQRTEFDGWDFLFAIAENHPFSKSGKHSIPFETTEPEPYTGAKGRNHSNTMNSEERYMYYIQWWNRIGECLPFPEWRAIWNQEKKRLHIENRRLLLRSLWKIRCGMEQSLELLNRTKFNQLCARLASARSGCGKKPRAKTCRRLATIASGKKPRRITHRRKRW